MSVNKLCFFFESEFVSFSEMMKILLTKKNGRSLSKLQKTTIFIYLLRASRGARNPNLNVAFTNACAAVV